MLFCGSPPAAGEAPVAPPPGSTVVNGDFSAPLDQGWREEAEDIAGEHEVFLSPDSSATVRMQYCGTASLVQTVNLPDLKRVFSTRVRAKAYSSKPEYWASAGISLTYLDADGTALGETFIGLATDRTSLAPGPKRHTVSVAGPDSWVNVTLNLASELKTNLSGLDAARAKAVRIALTAHGSGTSTC
jgi:hypothetical protein